MVVTLENITEYIKDTTEKEVVRVIGDAYQPNRQVPKFRVFLKGYEFSGALGQMNDGGVRKLNLIVDNEFCYKQEVDLVDYMKWRRNKKLKELGV